PAQARRPRGPPRVLQRITDESRIRTLLGGVDDLDATILGPTILVGVGAGRPLFAIADDGDLAAGTAIGLKCGRDGVAAALAQAQVVFTAAALVGIAFQRHARGRTIAQVFGVAGHGRLEFW